MSSPPDVTAPDQVGTEGRAQGDKKANGSRSVDRPFVDYQARLALKGVALDKTPSGLFVVSRWNLHKVLDTIEQVEAFAKQVGA
jgi:hypothetical protein